MSLSLRAALAARQRDSSNVSCSDIAKSLGLSAQIGVRDLLARLMEFRVVAIGDSVIWGQGLAENQKTRSLVTQHLAARYPELSVQLFNFSHSGAIVGDPGTIGQRGQSLFEELPTDLPTLFGQSQLAESHTGGSVDLILVCMSINDINFRKIIDPVGSDIDPMCRSACLEKTTELFRLLRLQFPQAQVVCHGYYKLLSRESNLLNTKLVGLVLGAIVQIPIATFLGVLSIPLLETIRIRCEQFFVSSEKYLAEAAKRFDKILFVPSVYSDRNALFAADPFLFSFNSDLSLQDDPDVIGKRAAACQQNRPDDPLCEVASVGHPNNTGARKTAERISALIDGMSF
jgi:lysophospholipase L1-like esterase